MGNILTVNKIYIKNKKSNEITKITMFFHVVVADVESKLKCTEAMEQIPIKPNGMESNRIHSNLNH